MLSKSLSTAKLLLVLSIGICLTSIYFGSKWTTEIGTLSGVVKKASHNLKEMTVARDTLNELLVPDTSQWVLDTALSEVMLRVYNERVRHGVAIALVSPAKLTMGGGTVRLDSIAEVVPGTRVRSVRVNLTGTYTTYPGLLSYIEALDGLPVAIARLKIQDQSYEMSLRVYGN